MDLATMRTRFRVMVADRANQIADSEVDQRLNQVWRYEFPERVDGVFRTGEIRFTLKDGQESYDLDDSSDVGDEAQRMHSVYDGVMLTNRTNKLVLFTVREDFYSKYRRSDLNTQDTPTGVLVSGRELSFRPIPSGGQEVAVPGTVYKPALTATGIPNDQWANAVTLGAARNYAIDNSYDDLLTKLDPRYREALDGVEATSRATPRQRHYKRSGYGGTSMRTNSRF